ncbi:hypothetical protein [Chamaesiphon sp.]|uniref:hypothetical protein n=1 Tax=Chamaesiphon sp. TaxID=2814140 RepID=UPI0035943DF7
MVKQILQIIPTPPNSSDGIGDYALLLAIQLRQDFQVDTRFLVFRDDVPVEPTINGFASSRLPAHNPAAFCSSIPADTKVIIIHFSGYPYFHTNLKGAFGIGTPFWLIDALRLVVKSHQLKLIVMFHELPKLHWQQFYVFEFLNPIHSIVSRRLARMADAVLTSSTNLQAILSQWLGKDITKISIFSGIGEPESVPPFGARQPHLVIFGGSPRNRIYQNHFPALIQSCKLLGIEAIYDIGPPLKLPEDPSSEIELVAMGFLSQAEISQRLLTARIGCIDYTPFPGNLAKSSVFAAYCAHGLLPILTRYNPSEADGLHLDRHYLVLGNKLDDVNLDRAAAIADRAHEWYQSHTIAEIAKTFFACIANAIA